MFNCYLHGWSNPTYACPICFPNIITTSTGTTSGSLNTTNSSKHNMLKFEVNWTNIYDLKVLFDGGKIETDLMFLNGKRWKITAEEIV